MLSFEKIFKKPHRKKKQSAVFSDFLTLEDKKQIDTLVEKETVVEIEAEKQKRRIEGQIIAIQKSTKVSIRVFERLHNSLRARYQWYYRWHLNPFSGLVHGLALTGFTTVVAIFVFVSIFSRTDLIMAASKQSWGSEITWKKWTLNGLSVNAGNLTLAPNQKTDSQGDFDKGGSATLSYIPFKGEVVDWLSSNLLVDQNGGDVKAEYSTDNILFTDDISTLADSETLYIKLQLQTENANQTPIIHSLAIDYSRLPIAPKDLAFKTGGIFGSKQILSAGGFTDPDNDEHKASQWQITDATNNFNKPLLDSEAVSGDKALTSYTLSKRLAIGDYYFRVRYQDTTGAWGLWSTGCAFTIDNGKVQSLGDKQIKTDPNEDIAKRTENTKTINNDNKTKTLKSYSGIIHYKENYNDPKAEWRDVNPYHSVDMPDYVLFDQMPSTVKVFKNKIGYEIKSRKTGATYTVELQNVDGQPRVSSNGQGNDAGINSSPDTGIVTDVLSTTILPKVLAQTNTQTNDANLKFEFEVSESGVRLWKTIEGADAPRNFEWKVTKTGSGNDLKFREDPEAFKIADKSAQVDIATQKIGKGNSFTWKETAPQTDIKIDTDVTYNPDPHTETSSVDGQAQLISSNTWAYIVGSVAGSSASDTAQSGFVAQAWRENDSTSRALTRGFFLFDTDGIPAGSTINSATLSIYGATSADGGNLDPNINIYSSSPASNTAIITDDYDQVGSTAFSTAIAFDSWNQSGYKIFLLMPAVFPILPRGQGQFQSFQPETLTTT